MLTDVDETTGEYRIPRIIYSDAYASEMVSYADLVLPDTTYLERWDCISLLDRPISTAHGPADSIRQPVVQPNRNVRPFQEVLIDIGARLGLPAFVKDDGSPAYPGGYPDYMVNHERTPGIGPLAGWRGDGTAHGRGAPVRLFVTEQRRFRASSGPVRIVPLRDGTRHALKVPHPVRAGLHVGKENNGALTRCVGDQRLRPGSAARSTS